MSRCPWRKRHPRWLRAGVLLTLVAGILFSSPGTSRADEISPLDGKALYAEYCASCHRSLGKTLLTGRTASRIRSAIRYFGVMSGLDGLDDRELGAIAAALADPTMSSPERISLGSK